MEKKVGELGKSTGISVRTLHHYDEIGLLKPSERTDSGHRVYSRSDIVRLHRILALRKLGLSLDQVGEVIGDSLKSLKELLDRHIEVTESEIDQRESTLRMLKNTLSFMDLKESIDLKDVTEAIKEFSLHEKYYSKQQLNELEERERLLGKDAIKAAINEWPKLIEKVKAEMKAGTDPTSTQVQTLTKRWLELKEMFTGGNKQIEANTIQLYQENPEISQKYQLDPSIFEYIQISANSLRKG